MTAGGTLFQLRDDEIVNVSEIKSAMPKMVTLYSGASYSITPEQWERLKGVARQPDMIARWIEKAKALLS